MVCETVTTFKVSLRLESRTHPEVHEDWHEGGAVQGIAVALSRKTARDCVHERLSHGFIAHREMVYRGNDRAARISGCTENLC